MGAPLLLQTGAMSRAPTGNGRERPFQYRCWRAHAETGPQGIKELEMCVLPAETRARGKNARRMCVFADPETHIWQELASNAQF